MEPTHAIYKNDPNKEKYLIHEITENSVLLGLLEYPEIEQDFYTELSKVELITETEEKELDLFEYYEEQPEEVKAILSRYELEEIDYNTCENLLAELNAIGYTFEYGLSAEPFNLRKILN